MSLTELMSNMSSSAMPQIALVIFLVTFIAIVVQILRRSAADVQRAARLPLDDLDIAERGARSNPAEEAR